MEGFNVNTVTVITALSFCTFWPVGSADAHISGEVELEGCSVAARDNINDAMAIILDRLDDSDYLACLKDAVVTETFGATPENVLDRLRDNMPTKIICKEIVCGNASTLGCAGITDGAEMFSIKSSHAQSSMPVSVAATIVHEVTHRKGFGHPGSPTGLDYPFTLPVQTATCVRNMAADGLDRSEAPGDTDLAPFGGKGGEAFERWCGPGKVMTGMSVRSSDLINSIVIHCEAGDLAPIGSTSDSRRTIDRQCAADERVVAIRAQSNSILSYLAMACAKRTDLVANVENPPVTWRYLGGAGGDAGGLRRCPTGMAVKGLHGHAGAKIDELRVLCEDEDGLAQNTPKRLPLAGKRSGQSKLGFCIGRGIMTALYGHSGGSIDRLGGACYPTQSSNVITGEPELVISNNTRHVFDWNGGNGGNPFSLKCEDGQALVGIDLHVGTGVDGLRGVCVVPKQWASSGASAPQLRTSWVGRSNGAITSRTCAQGAYLIGLHTWAKKAEHATPTLQGLEPICRRINYSQKFPVAIE